MTNADPPELAQSAKQRRWGRPLLDCVMDEMVDSLFSASDKARWRAVSAPHVRDSFLGMPIALCGLKLDDEAVRVAVGLQLGANLCEPYTCLRPLSHCAWPSRPLVYQRLRQTSETWGHQ